MPRDPWLHALPLIDAHAGEAVIRLEDDEGFRAYLGTAKLARPGEGDSHFIYGTAVSLLNRAGHTMWLAPLPSRFSLQVLHLDERKKRKQVCTTMFGDVEYAFGDASDSSSFHRQVRGSFARCSPETASFSSG